MTAPNRRAKGERFPQSKLKESEIPVIRGLLALKVPHRQIAEQFDVSNALICKINRGLYWKHVE